MSSFPRLRKLRSKRHLPSKPNTTVYSYPGQNHAFSRHNGAHYNAEAAALAHERTYAFLNQQLRFRAERELTIQDVPLSIQNDAVTVKLAIEDFPASTLIVSISARSVLILSLKDDASNDCEGAKREFLRIISLPVEVDAARVTSELDDRDLAIRLPLLAGALSFSESANV
jgi:hypothetical protein